VVTGLPCILRLTDGLRITVGSVVCVIPPVRLHAGQWMALVPENPDPAMDPAGTIARCLISLHPPTRGTVEVFEQDVYNIGYREVQRLRARLGFVQGYGGLLSNRTIRDNVALPVSEHARLPLEEETALVHRYIEAFGLHAVADQRPHMVDGFTRWRTCLARAMVLSPAYLVLEGIGDWAMDSGTGIAWRQLVAWHQTGRSGICICASRRNRGFESWLEERGGIVVEYKERSV